MSADERTHESLAPAPGGSRWGRTAAAVYCGVAALAFGFTLREMVTDRSGLATWALSVLTAPWSVLLAVVARAVAGRLEPGATRVLGVVLVLVSGALNARILYGIGARAERDARDSHR